MKDYKYNKHQRAWLDDLKKTRAKQGAGYLHCGGWCCLGRACYVLGVEEERRGYFEGEDQELPAEVSNKLHIDVLGTTKEPLNILGQTYLCLADANDAGCTFKQIAAAIEADPRNFFYD